MGSQLAKIYDIVTEKKGYEGRMKFAQKTGISKKKAMALKDNEKISRKLKAVATEFLGENIDNLL